MRIGVPSETKTLEGRVALVPAACADLVRRGHEVYVQAGAGLKSGFKDEDYARVGVKLAADAKEIFSSEKVKKQLFDLGAVAAPNTPEEFTALGRAEREKYKQIVAEAGLAPQ